MTWDPWETAQDAFWAEEGIAAVQEDLRVLKRYARVAGLLVPKFELLAQALETKKIATYASRIGGRIATIHAMAGLLEAAPPLIAELESECEELYEAVADGAVVKDIVYEVGQLPGYKSLLNLSQQLLEIEFQVAEEEDDGFIDWTLQEYLGGQAVIARRLEKTTPVVLHESDFVGSSGLYGVLVYYSDIETIEERIAEIRSGETGTEDDDEEGEDDDDDLEDDEAV